jgi:anti-sigma factor RsiW
VSDDNRSAGQTDDEILVAFLDGEMDPTESARLAARLNRDQDLRDRLEALKQSGLRMRAALDELLEDAPIQRMRAGLSQALNASRREPRLRWLTRAAAAALVGAFFAGGFATSRLLERPSGPSSEDWRRAVAEYMEMYSPETFRPQESAALRDDLSALGSRLGLELDADALRVAGLELRRVEILQYEGAPLGELGYLNATTLVAFCILRDGEAAAPLTTGNQGAFTSATWAKGGRGYMVIGKLPREKIAAIAGKLIDRF